MEDRTHKNLEDQHPSASSLKLYQNLEDKHPGACSLKFKYQNLKNRHPNARSLKKYVKEINGEVEILRAILHKYLIWHTHTVEQEQIWVEQIEKMMVMVKRRLTE